MDKHRVYTIDPPGKSPYNSFLAHAESSGDRRVMRMSTPNGLFPLSCPKSVRDSSSAYKPLIVGH